MKAVWSYLPAENNYCDNCVPRGCTCNQNEKGEESLDEQGRKEPCCEYSKIDEFFHDQKECVDVGWEVYYKHHPEKRIEDEADYWEEKLGSGGIEPIIKQKRKLNEK